MKNYPTPAEIVAYEDYLAETDEPLGFEEWRRERAKQETKR